MAEGDGGCTAAAVKSMEQPRRRNAARLRDVYRFRRRYRRRDAPKTVGRNYISNPRFSGYNNYIIEPFPSQYD